MIELATAEDWPEIQEIFQASGQAAWPHIIPIETLGALQPPERWREMIGTSLPAGEIWLSKLRESSSEPWVPVGFIILRRSEDADAEALIGEVDGFYTRPSVWGKGAGRELMTHGLGRLSQAGFREATLWTEERNDRPRRFYERTGFHCDGASREREVRAAPLRELRYRLAFVSDGVN